MKARLLLAGAILSALLARAQTGNVGIGTLSPTDQLHTTGTVRFQNYVGFGNRLVQLDAAGRLVVTGNGAVFKATPGSGILDNGCTASSGLSSAITVSGQAASVPSVKIAVRVNITHPSSQELRIFLVAPSGQILRLSNGAGSGANYTNTILTDEAVGFVSNGFSPLNGKYKPSGGLSASCGVTPTVSTFGELGSSGTISANGIWELRVFDAQAALGGVLNSWDISFSGAESFTTAEQDRYLPRFNGGTLAASTLYQGTGNTLGIRSTDPAAALHISDAGGDSLLLLQNPDALGAGTRAFMDFRNGPTYTGRIGTLGTDAQSASLGFYTSAGTTAASLQKRLSILDNGNIGIGLQDANVNELLHVDGNLRLGFTTRTAATQDRFLKFGDGDYVTIGESADDDDMWLTAEEFHLRALNGATRVGINNPTPLSTLDVTGTLHTTGLADVDGGLQVAGAATFSSPVTAAGLVTANSGLTVNGQTTLGNVTTSAITASSLTAGYVASTGAASVSQNLTVFGTTTAAAVNATAVNASTSVSTPSLTVSGGSPAAGKVLTATANAGTTAWQYLVPHNTMVKAHNATNMGWWDETPEVIDTLVEDFDPGNNFNPTTGVYTAPSTGYYQYHFSCSGFISEAGNPNSDINFYVEIFVNNALVESYRVPLNPPGAVFNKDLTTMLNLSQGSTVYTRIRVRNFTYYAAGTAPTNGFIEAGSAMINCYRIH